VLTPAVRRLVKELNLDATAIPGSGKDGRIQKADVMRHLDAKVVDLDPDLARAAQGAAQGATQGSALNSGGRNERRVPMTRLRARIAERLLEAQRTAAILTTFNEVDLHEVGELRARHKEAFERRHGVRLGFMSFFVKAAVEALRVFPVVNATLDGNDVLYHDYFDIGIAVASERGLVVPILRDADALSLAGIELAIRALAEKAKTGTLTIEDLQGGTFSITNGGVFGSLLSTPILNPPQSAILGMHAIKDRPVVVAGEIVVRPMMYLALSYDHRLIDGKDAVQFLVRIKEALEDPARLLLEI
jgi:2-oxoglutarate dehydrogenase E2 component (dihydrolipoamide succinyltransferase)